MPKKIPLYFYVVAGVLFFLFWLWMAFPEEAIEARLNQEIAKRAQNYDIQAKETDLSLFGSLHYENIKVFKKAPEGNSLVFKAREVDLSFSPFKISGPEPEIEFAIKSVKGGEITGIFKKEEGEESFEAELEDYPLQDVPALKDQMDINVTGKLSGKIDLKRGPRSRGLGEGNIQLEFIDFKLPKPQEGQSPSLVHSMLGLPDLVLSGKKGSVLNLRLLQDTWRIQSFKLTGGDLDLNIKGRIKVAKNFKNFNFNLSGNYRVQNTQSLQSLVSLAGGGSGPIRLRGIPGRSLQLTLGQQTLPLGGSGGF